MQSVAGSLPGHRARGRRADSGGARERLATSNVIFILPQNRLQFILSDPK